MVRRKIKIKRIENDTSRQVTFSKRRGGLLKKAHDLAVLCDAEVGVIIFSGKGKLFQFASPSMGSVLDRYTKSSLNTKARDNDNTLDPWVNHMVQSSTTDRVTEFIEKVKSSQSNLIGDDLERLSLRDLIHLERQIHDSLGRIRSKKEELLLEQLEDIKEKVTEARRTTNVTSSILENLVDFGPDYVMDSRELCCQGDTEHSCPQGAAQIDTFLSLWVDTSELTFEGLPVAKRSRITEDLNESPGCMEE